MLARRLLLLVAVLLVVGALASAVAPRDTTKKDQGPTSSAATQTAPAAAPGAGTTVTAELAGGTGGRTKTVRARVGDLIDLTVAAPGPDTVTIEGYDQIQPADPENPARFSFFADQQGNFDVTLQQAGTVAGRLEIEPAA